MSSLLDSRENCPCCGYPTLEESAAFEICELCNWEDDGQDAETENEVWGGPNGPYSLVEARDNFRRHRVMYPPEKDKRIGGPDTSLVFETKGKLMQAFSRAIAASPSERRACEAEILQLEAALWEELSRKVREYERKGNEA